MLRVMATRSARNFPLASSASSAVETLSRPCSSVTKPSRRSDVHFTGRPSRLRRPQHEHQLRVDAAAHAEAPADLAGDDAHVALRARGRPARRAGSGARAAPGCPCGACSARCAGRTRRPRARGSSGAAATRVTTKSSRVTCGGAREGARDGVASGPPPTRRRRCRAPRPTRRGRPGAWPPPSRPPRAAARSRRRPARRRRPPARASPRRRGPPGRRRGGRDRAPAPGAAWPEGGRSVAPLARAVDRQVAERRRRPGRRR